MTFKLYLLLILYLSSSLSAQEKKLLFIGIDGCRADALATANTPTMDELIDNGFFIDNALCSINGQATYSGPGWSSMITGVWYDKHGVTDNSFINSNFEDYPPFNILLEATGEEFHTASFIMWTPIHSEIFNGTMDHNEIFPDFDGSVAQGAADYILTEDLDILFLDFDHVDHIGHSYGFSPDIPEYINIIEEVDSYIGLVIDAMETRPNFANEEWLIFITSDHGGNMSGHGGQTIEERTIPMIMSGNSIDDSNLPNQVYIIDFIPTLMRYFGQEIDCAWSIDGNPVGLNTEIFPEYIPCPSCPYPLVAELNQTNYNISLSWEVNTVPGYSYKLYRNEEFIIDLDNFIYQYTDYPNLIGIEGEAIFEYSIIMSADSGEVICEAEVATELSSGIIIMEEDFDDLELFPAVDEALFDDGGCTNTIPQDILGWTHIQPVNWVIDNSLMPESGTLEWRGWSFASMEFWVMAEDQLRSQFIRAKNNVAVVDPDEWDDCGDGALAGSYNSILSSPYIFISAENSLQLTFDSHFRSEAPQQVHLTVLDSNGDESIILYYSEDLDSDNMGDDMLNEHLNFSYTSESDDYVRFNWEIADAGNNWYWAIDNVIIQIQTPALGDINDDGNINILDIISIMNIILDAMATDDILDHISDLNHDEVTNIMDIILLVTFILEE